MERSVYFDRKNYRNDKLSVLSHYLKKKCEFIHDLFVNDFA